MRNGTTTIDELASQLRLRNGLALRVALYRQNDRWIVGLMDAHAGPTHGLPKWRKYMDRDFAFLAARVPGAQIADWLTSSQGQISAIHFSLPQTSDTVNWQQKTSQPSWALVSVHRPLTEFTVHSAGRGNLESLEVAGAKGPYFQQWRLACLALLYDRWDSAQTTSLPAEVCTIRFESPGPWLENIHIAAAAVQIAVGGALGRGCRLQIVSPVGLLGDYSVTRRRRKFTLATAIPAGLTHVVLVRGDEVIDSRMVSMTRIGPQRVQDADVTFDPPARTESLENQIAGGEGPTTEFKEDLPRDEQRIPVAVSAFANTGGGAIFIGVDNHGNIKGIAADRVAQLADTTVNRLRQKVRPFPPVRTETAVVGGKNIVVVWVEAGQEGPFGVGDRPVAYYIRRGANNFHATPEEIRALVQTRTTPISPYARIGL